MLNRISKISNQAVVIVCVVALLALSIASICGFYANANPYFELASHLRFLYLLGFLPFLITLILLRSWKLFSAFLVSFIVNVVPILQLYLPSHEAASGSTSITVFQTNVWGPRNPHHDKVLALIRERSADIVGATEVTDGWVRDLTSGLHKYKYHVIEKNFGGVALFSKYPITASEIKYFGLIKRPRIEAHILVEGSPVFVIFAHPTIPKGMLDIRNGELTEIAQMARHSNEPVIVFGDMNCSPWSYYFGKFLKAGKLNDTERGFGFQPTWSTKWFFPWVPIDHCFVSDDFSATSRVVGPYVGSDHLPVFVKLVLSDLVKNGQQKTESQTVKN